MQVFLQYLHALLTQYWKSCEESSEYAHISFTTRVELPPRSAAATQWRGLRFH